MAETKIQERKRIIAHKRRKEEERRRKQEEKEMLETFDALSKDYGRQLRANWTVEPIEPLTSMHSTTLAADIATQIDKEIMEEIAKAVAIPEHMLRNNHFKIK